MGISLPYLSRILGQRERIFVAQNNEDIVAKLAKPEINMVTLQYWGNRGGTNAPEAYRSCPKHGLIDEK